MPPPAPARRTVFSVRYVAQGAVYIDAGSAEGIAPGMIVEISRHERGRRHRRPATRGHRRGYRRRHRFGRLRDPVEGRSTRPKAMKPASPPPMK